MEEFYLDKFRGALVGLTIGNAIGKHFKGNLHEDISLKHSQFLKYVRKNSKKFDYHSQDTQLTLHTSNALIKGKGYNADILIQNLIRWLDDLPENSGYNTQTSIKKLKYGIPLQKAASNSGGNGPLARITPIGLFYSKDLVKLREVTIASTNITHSHPAPIGSALIFARAIAFLLEKESTKGFSIDLFFDSLKTMISHSQKEVWDNLNKYLDKLKKNLNLSLKSGIIKFSQLGVKSPYFIEEYLGKAFVHPYSISTIICTFFIFLKNLQSFEKCIFELVIAGGATDSVGALGGAVAGSYLGEKEIPNELLSIVNNYQEISEKAENLFRSFQKKYLTKYNFEK